MNFNAEQVLKHFRITAILLLLILLGCTCQSDKIVRLEGNDAKLKNLDIPRPFFIDGEHFFILNYQNNDIPKSAVLNRNNEIFNSKILDPSGPFYSQIFINDNTVLLTD